MSDRKSDLATLVYLERAFAGPAIVHARTRDPERASQLPLEPDETTWDAAPVIPEDGKGPAWGRKLRDYDPEFWREVADLHRSGNHEIAEAAVRRGNLRPIKPAASLGSLLQSFADGKFTPRRDDGRSAAEGRSE